MTASQPPARARRGCLFYAICIGLLLFLLVIIGAGVGYLALRKAADNITQTHPVEVQRVQVSQSEAAALQKKLESFKNAVVTDSPAGPLTLTDREINGLIATSPDLSNLDGKLHLTIRDGLAQGEVSIPLDDVGVTFLKGRYLNGVGVFKPSIENGELRVMLQDFQVNGKTLPRRWMNMLQKYNLAEKVNRNPDAAALLKKLKDIEMKSNVVEIVPLQK